MSVVIYEQPLRLADYWVCLLHLKSQNRKVLFAHKTDIWFKEFVFANDDSYELSLANTNLDGK